MAKPQIKASRRAKAAIAAIMSVSTMIGGVYYVVRPGQEPTPAAIVLASETLIRPWEGRELRAYLDRIAKPPVWTVCDGDTENVKPGMVETPAGCDRRLTKRLTKDFYPGLKNCIAHFETKPVSWQAMMTSLSYNIGIGAACKSTAARLGRADRFQDSCIAATAFNKAGGKMIVGLVYRREMGDATRIGEAELCLSGLDEKKVTPPVVQPAPAPVPTPAPLPAPKPVEKPVVKPAEPVVTTPTDDVPLALIFGVGLVLVAGGVVLVIRRRRKT